MAKPSLVPPRSGCRSAISALRRFKSSMARSACISRILKIPFEFHRRLIPGCVLRLPSIRETSTRVRTLATSRAYSAWTVDKQIMLGLLGFSRYGRSVLDSGCRGSWRREEESNLRDGFPSTAHQSWPAPYLSAIPPRWSHQRSIRIQNQTAELIWVKIVGDPDAHLVTCPSKKTNGSCQLDDSLPFYAVGPWFAMQGDCGVRPANAGAYLTR